MTVFNPQKTISPTHMDCDGSAVVTLSFQAKSGLCDHPADIVLVMDRSCSMDNLQMCLAIQGVKKLLQILSEACIDDGSGNFGGGTRVGLVSFASEATQDVPLTNLRRPILAGLSELTASGATNHRAAFEAAESMLGPKGANRQIVILFTDGLTTVGGDAVPVTDRMKAAGVEIFCIGKDPSLLNRWASTPLGDHVYTTLDQSMIPGLFQEVANQIILPDARDIVIQETLSPDFRMMEILTVSKGSARIVGDQKLLWTIDSAGLEPETLTLTFKIRHIGTTGGIKAFNHSVIYGDHAGNELHFPNPTVQVTCPEGPFYPEPCPVPTVFVVPNCQDAVRVDLDETALSSLGRILQLNITLKSVCPGKRVGVSVILTEIGPHGREYPRGAKHILVPAQTGDCCRDVAVRCVQFSMPEALDPSGCTDTICNARRFQAQVIANYVDTDYRCCDRPDVTP